MIIDFLEKQIAWSRATFGSGKRTKGICEHIRKELREIESAPDDVEEWIDVVILAFDGAWRAGFSPVQIVDTLQHKLNKNRNRKWPKSTSEDLPTEHDRSEE